MSYEYKVVPAPSRGLKAKGSNSAEDRFAHALETEMNALASDGWEYLRADTLPCEQREGLMGKTTVYQNMLVFRRLQKVTESKEHKPILKAEPPVARPRDNQPQMTEDEQRPAPVAVKEAKPPSTDMAAE